MSLKIDAVLHATRQVAKEVKDFQKNLTLHFIVHHEGQLNDTLSMAMHDVVRHPANKIALQILDGCSVSERSRFLGVAAAQQNIFMGLATNHFLLALNTLNIEEFESIKEAKRYAYHMAWHALDAYDYYRDPKNRNGKSKERIIRKRSALDLTAANIRADVFAVIASHFQGDKSAMEQLCDKRALSVLSAMSDQKPEFYAYAIAAEATKAAIDKLREKHVSKRNLIGTALKIADHVGEVYNEAMLKNWLSFSQPAQDMAWRGYDKADILSAAINTSKETSVRSMGYMISDLVEIKPSSMLEIRSSYSPFADDDYNAKLHIKAVQKVFEDVFAQGLREYSSRPFIQLANKQNDDLTDGHVLGWCASSLQAAAQAFDTAVAQGEDPNIDIHDFISAENLPLTWQELKSLGDLVIQENRRGNIITLSRLQDIAKELEGIQEIQNSIQKTLEDPSYQKALAMVQEYSAEPSIEPAAPSLLRSLDKAPKTPIHAAEATPDLKLSGKAAQAQKAQAEASKAAEEKTGG